MAIYPYPGEPYRSTVLSYEWLITGLAPSERVSDRLTNLQTLPDGSLPISNDLSGTRLCDTCNPGIPRSFYGVVMAVARKKAHKMKVG
jgi:hypothetical protein